MVNIYETSNGYFKKIENIKKECWIDLVNPSLEELKMVSQETNTPLNILTKLMDDEELSRIDARGNISLIVVDIPYVIDTNYKHRYNTAPLGIIINNDGYFITMSLKKLQILDGFINDEVNDFDVKKRTKFVVQILIKVAQSYQKELADIDHYINNKEKILYKSTNNKELIDLLNIEKTLVYFSTSLKANEAVLEKLLRGSVLPLYDEDVSLVEDAVIENKQAIEMSNIYREILTSMTDTYATIISNNLNDVMKFLAGITIVFSIPTMVASFIGMNVPLGEMGKSPVSFILIIVFSIVLSLIIAFILKKKNML